MRKEEQKLSKQNTIYIVPNSTNKSGCINTPGLIRGQVISRTNRQTNKQTNVADIQPKNIMPSPENYFCGCWMAKTFNVSQPLLHNNITQVGHKNRLYFRVGNNFAMVNGRKACHMSNLFQTLSKKVLNMYVGEFKHFLPNMH